jgi:gamma-glutamylcyclotransferase (GGCT)/AIG2-like uncharacterized protein YtfP
MDTITDNILVAAYGTLREGWGNNARYLKDSKHLGTGKTVNKYTMRSSGIPFVSKEPLTTIVVDVYKVNNETLNRLDSLEGHPEWYRREKTDVVLNDKVIPCWLYFNEGYKDAPIVESGDFNSKII